MYNQHQGMTLPDRSDTRTSEAVAAAVTVADAVTVSTANGRNTTAAVMLSRM